MIFVDFVKVSAEDTDVIADENTCKVRSCERNTASAKYRSRGEGIYDCSLCCVYVFLLTSTSFLAQFSNKSNPGGGGRTELVHGTELRHFLGCFLMTESGFIGMVFSHFL